MDPDFKQCDATLYLQQWNGFKTAWVNESLGSTEIFKFFSDYIITMTSTIEDHGGIVVNLDQEQLLAIFEAEDNTMAVDNAASCALECKREIIQFSTRWQQQTAFELAIGIHFGRLCYGRFGSGENSHSTVLGDSVSLAQQLLHQATADFSIVVSEFAQRQLPNHHLQALDSIMIKGMQNPLALYRLQQ